MHMRDAGPLEFQWRRFAEYSNAGGAQPCPRQQPLRARGNGGTSATGHIAHTPRRVKWPRTTTWWSSETIPLTNDSSIPRLLAVMDKCSDYLGRQCKCVSRGLECGVTSIVYWPSATAPRGAQADALAGMAWYPISFFFRCDASWRPRRPWCMT